MFRFRDLAMTTFPGSLNQSAAVYDLHSGADPGRVSQTG